MKTTIRILLLLLPSAFALGADVPLFTAPSQSGLTFAQTPHSQSTFSLPHYATPPAQETAEQAASRLIRDGAYTRDLGQANQINLEQAQKEMDSRKAELSRELEANREARNLAEQGLGGDASALIKEQEQIIESQRDMAERQKSMDELKGRAVQQMVAGQEMQNSGNTLKSTLSLSDGCKGGGGGGAGGGGGSGGGGGGGGNGGAGFVAAAVGVAALGAMLGVMAGSGGKDEQGNDFDKYLEDQKKRTAEENRLAAEERDQKAADTAEGLAQEERERGIKESNDELSRLFANLRKDSQTASKASAAPDYTAPRGTAVATVDLKIIRCFRLPGGIAVPCQPGLAQLCVNQAGQSLPCP